MAVQQIDNLIKFTNSQGTSATGTMVQITRTSLVMEVYNPYSIVQLSEMLSAVTVRRSDNIIYNGRAVVSTLVNTGLYLVVSATLVDPWQDLMGIDQDSESVQQEAQRLLDDWENSHQLNPAFQLTVLKIRSMLGELSRWLEQVDLLSEQDGIRQGDDKGEALFQKLKAFYHPRLYAQFQLFEQEAAKIAEKDFVKYRQFAQRDLHPFILRAPFVWRTFNKPLGYAGDYEMVNMMLRDFNEGPTSYAKLMNALFLSSGPAAAHRNRIDLLCQCLSKNILSRKEKHGAVKILNIGCGPALELQRLIKDKVVDESCDITLLDFSEETLRYTQDKIEGIAHKTGCGSLNIRYEHKSVHTLLKEASRTGKTGKGDYDIVYCAGLFDYLSDKVCTRLIRLFTHLNKSEGMTLVTNVHPSNPVKHIMNFLLEWYLIYRDEQQMENLYLGDINKNVYVDETNINVFMEIG